MDLETMLDMMRMLYAHQASADSAILTAIANHPVATQDDTLRKTLHHMVLVQRFYLSVFLDRPFDVAAETQVPATLAEVGKLFRASHAEQLALIERTQQADLAQPFETPFIPGARFTLSEAHMQVVMHSQHHRGQCCTRLRALGGDPPVLDFVIWLKDRPAAWS